MKLVLLIFMLLEITVLHYTHTINRILLTYSPIIVSVPFGPRKTWNYPLHRRHHNLNVFFLYRINILAHKCVQNIRHSQSFVSLHNIPAAANHQTSSTRENVRSSSLTSAPSHIASRPISMFISKHGPNQRQRIHTKLYASVSIWTNVCTASMLMSCSISCTN